MSNADTQKTGARPRAHLAAQEIFRLVSLELSLVEAEWERQTGSNTQVIDYLSSYLRAAGGKRVRPALTILSHYAAGGDDGAGEAVIRLATVMECLHTATLVHDDIIDNAETRRRRPSINARYGNQAAVLLGDWLYMSAFAHSLAQRSWEILDLLTNVTRQMTEGELLQLTVLGNTDITETQYFEVLRRKTAYLFSACCEIGAILAGATPTAQSGLCEYGLQLGLAFQLVDDLLDCTVAGETLGKAAGADLLEGKLTLPLIYLLQKDESWRARLQSVMWDGSYTRIPRADLLTAIRATGVGERARSRALACAEAARAALATLPRNAHRAALAALPAYILERES